MRRMSGPLLVATGVLDILYVLVSYSRQFIAIFQEGLVDAVEVVPVQLDRETAFWHLMFGATFVVLGGLVCWTQSRTGTLPVFLGWSLLALGLFGAIFVPVSGFWLVLLLALLVLLAARRGATAETGTVSGGSTDGRATSNGEIPEFGFSRRSDRNGAR
jgi:hypothetical protein